MSEKDLWAEKWVEALRSGEYKQGKNRLRSNDDEFCCLGVLCDQMQKAGVMPFWETIKMDGIEDTSYRCAGEITHLPIQAAELVGLTTPDGAFKADSKYPPTVRVTSSLMLWNDEGKTFEEIANLIESRPAGLFGELDEENWGI